MARLSFGVDAPRGGVGLLLGGIATTANVRAAGVVDRVRIASADICSLPFPDGMFDCVVSSLVVHNLPGTAARGRAIGEFVRVLRPGGRLSLFDLANTRSYAVALRDAGMLDVKHSWPRPLFAPPWRIVAATKPDTAT